MYGLLDCNSFYASCERLFRPDLEGKPIAVLSNNDGCVISMSSEAKELGITLGTPYFKCRALLKGKNSAVFSSNFPLYGDISARVMDCLRMHNEKVMVYSIDEAFFVVPQDERKNAAGFLSRQRETVLRWCGVPVGIGAGPTKVLAKVANRLAKRNVFGEGGVHVIDDESSRIEALRLTPVGDVWGIGRRLKVRLRDQGIETALDFSRQPEFKVRGEMGLAAYLTLKGLNGEQCSGAERSAAMRKSIIHSRMLPKSIKDVERLVAVVRSFATRICERARQLGLKAGMIDVYITTTGYTKGKYHSESRVQRLSPPSHDSWELMAVVESLVRSMYKNGCNYKRAGITLFELTDDCQGELGMDVSSPSRKQLLGEIDRLNLRYGRNTVRFGGMKWRQNQLLHSPQYTTSKHGVLEVR